MLWQYQFEDTQRAHEYWNRVLQLKPTDGDALAALHELCKELNHARELLTILEKRSSLSANPTERYHLLLERGRVASELLEHELAASCFEKAVEVQPHASVALNALIDTYTCLGQYDPGYRCPQPHDRALYVERRSSYLSAKSRPTSANVT